MTMMKQLQKVCVGFLILTNFIVLFSSAQSCVDSTIRLRIFKPDGSRIFRNCNWVARNDVENRCSFDGVSESCPLTCNSCDECVDSPLRLKIVKASGKKISRGCSWVANRPGGRCGLDGVANTCRATCGTCSPTAPTPTAPTPTAPTPTAPTPTTPTPANFVRLQSTCQNPMTLEIVNGLIEAECADRCEQNSSKYLKTSFIIPISL